MTDEVNDVQEQAEPTAEASSAENETTETTQDEVVDTPSSRDDSEVDESGVPIKNRLAETQRKLEKLERELSEVRTKSEPQKPANPQDEVIKKQLDGYLKEMGYVSKDELERREADKQLQSEVERLKSTYDGKDGRPKFDYEKALDFAEKNLIGNLEVAYKQMNEAKLTDWAVKQALGKTKGVKSEVSDGSSKSVPDGQDELKEKAARGDADARQVLIRRALS